MFRSTKIYPTIRENPLKNPDLPSIDLTAPVGHRGVKEYRLHVGLLTSDQKRTHSASKVTRMIAEWRSQGLGPRVEKGMSLPAGTMWTGTGLWYDEKGREFYEPTLIFSLYEVSGTKESSRKLRELVQELGHFLACELNQQSVVYVEFGAGGGTTFLPCYPPAAPDMGKKRKKPERAIR